MKYIIYDLEATCWRGRPPGGHNEVIEIGAVKIDEYAQVVSSFNKFIKPLVNPVLSSFCKKLTSISQENVDSAKLFDKTSQEFIDWMTEDDEEYFLCAWGQFDQQLLINDCNLHKIDYSWTYNHVDIKSQYHSYKKMPKHGGLKATVKKEGFQFDGIQHRAISDAENLAKIFIKYFDEWVFHV